VALIGVSACVDPYSPSIIQDNQRILVIEGQLISNDSTFIKLSRSKPIESDNIFEPEQHAIVYVETEDGVKFQLQEKAAGIYAAPPLNLDYSLQYRLHVRTGDTEEYVSDFAVIKHGHEIDSVTFKEIPEGDLIEFYVYAHDPGNDTRYYMWTCDETFMYNSISRSRYYFENNQIFARASSEELYNCWKTNSTNNFYLTSTEKLAQDVVYDFPLYQIRQASPKLLLGYSVLLKQYALTAEGYQYWSSIKLNSEELGGLFDPIPSQSISNFRCLSTPSKQVIGYFGATSIVTKRIFFTRQEIKGPSTLYDATGYEDCGGNFIALDDINATNLEGLLIYDGVYNLVEPFELQGYATLTKECIDCRFKGGVLKKPDYWR
jgi:hypothetical protein